MLPIKEALPYQVVPGHDESLSSWLVRLSRHHYCNTKSFCSYYQLESLLKSSLDIDGDRALIRGKLKLDMNLPNTISDKLPSFKWERGKSKWLIEPNRKGQALLNSYTKICSGCLSEKGYYQLKWKLSLFDGCVDCGTYLTTKCPKCSRIFSPIKSDYLFPIEKDLNPLFHCIHCKNDLRELRTDRMTSKDLEKLILIHRAYEEEPANERYLTFLQFGVIEGISTHRL